MKNAKATVLLLFVPLIGGGMEIIMEFLSRYQDTEIKQVIENKEEGLTEGETEIRQMYEAYEEAKREQNQNAEMILAEYCGQYAEYYSDYDMGIKSAELYKALAAKDNAIAFRKLGHYYREGKFVEADVSKGIRCYQKAVELKDAEAAYFLGGCYETGKGVEVDDEKAVDNYQKGAEWGDADAQAQLGIAYYEGKGISKNYEKAFEWLNQAFKNGAKWGEYYLAVCYLNGLGTDMEEDTGFSVLEQVTKAGFIYKKEEAWQMLINCYEKGIGTEKNVAKAKELRQKVEKDKKLFRDAVWLFADSE